MMESRLVAAVVVNWNSYAVLSRCLAALKNQSLPFDRVIVVDNASNPQLETLPDPWSNEIEYVRLNKNIGFAAANNIAMRMLDGCKWVALVNPDAFLEPDWLQVMVSATIRYPSCASFAGTLIDAKAPSRLDGMGDGYHMSGKAWRHGHGCRRDMFSVIEREVLSPCAAAAIYRRDALLSAGGFDEDFFCYFEDVDLGLRLRLAGQHCMLIPSALAQHIGAATTGGQHSDFAVYHGHRNLVWTFVKNMPGILFWIMLPGHLLLNVITVLYFCFQGQGKVVMRAKWDAIKGLGGAWRKRKSIQASRVASIYEIWKVIDKRLLPLRCRR